MRWTPMMMVALVGALLAELPLNPSLARARARNHRADTMPVESIRRGMKGYGLSVFEGTRPERFAIEVIDVIENYHPAQDLILVKTSHPRLDVVNTVAGMSGSPIFINGKMVGAYAYGWPFGKEPVAGVTPIQNMLDDIDRPLPKEIFGWPLDLRPPSPRPAKPLPEAPAPSAASSRFRGTPGEYNLARHAEQLASNAPSSSLPKGAPRPLATPVSLGGMGSVGVGMARDLFEPLGLAPMQAGGGRGRVEPGTPEHFEEGGALAVELIRGDINATPLGTVTRVEGDRLVAFGHPMMNAGVTALPTAVGRVLWIMASEELSSKFGVAVRPLGAMVSDRQSSIVVSESAKAPVIPVTLHVNGVPGAPKHEWKFEIAQERFMAPSFLAMALGNALQATVAERQDVSWRARSTVTVREHREVTIEDYGVSTGGTPDPKELMDSLVVTAVGEVLNNPWQSAFIQSVTTSIELSYAREIVRLRGVRALEREIDPGAPAQLELTLVPYAGPPFTRTITVPMPRHLAGSTVELSIRPGHTVEREKAAPESLDELLVNLEDPIYPPKSIVVSYASGFGAAFKGRVAQQLPPGAFDSIQQHTSTFAPEAFRSEQRHVVELRDYMVGKDTVSVQIRPPLR